MMSCTTEAIEFGYATDKPNFLLLMKAAQKNLFEVHDQCLFKKKKKILLRLFCPSLKWV